MDLRELVERVGATYLVLFGVLLLIGAGILMYASKSTDSNDQGGPRER